MKSILVVLLLLIGILAAGCGAGDVSTEGVKEKEKQIDAASKKLNPTDDRSNEQNHN